MSCTGVPTGFVFGLELFKKMNSARLEFRVRDVLILYMWLCCLRGKYLL